MRYVSLLLGIVAMLAFIGCGDDPVSSAPEEGIASPSAKLTISSNKAGGYPGEMALRRLNQLGTDAFNNHDLAQTVALRTDDVITDYAPLAAPLEGKAGAEGFYGTLFTPASPDVEPDIHIDMERQFISGNMVVNETLIWGTHTVEWAGIPPTGNPYSLPHLSIYEYEGKKVKKETIFMDNVTLFTQFGVMPAGELPPLVPSIALPDPEPLGLSPVEAEIESIARFNSHDLGNWIKTYHTDAVVKYNTIGMVPLDRSAMVALNELFILGFSDLKLEVVRVVDLGEGWVLTETTVGGTHDGPYFGIPASGNFSGNRLGWVAHHDADGLVTEINFYYDEMITLVNIGAVQ